MGALLILGLAALGFAAASGGSRSSTRSRRTTADTPIAQLSSHDAAMRAGWTQTQQGTPAARAQVIAYLGAPGRTPVDAALFVRELQGFHQDQLAEFALDRWNALRGPSAPASGPTGDLALSPLQAARRCGDQSSPDACERYAAQWLGVSSRTSIDAGRFVHELQTLGLDQEAEYALDVWNQRPRQEGTA